MNFTCASCKRQFADDEPLSLCENGRWYLFCSIPCRTTFAHSRGSNRICAREGCNHKVPEGNRILCRECYQAGNELREPGTWFDKIDHVRWEQGKQEVLKRIEGQVRVFSARDMTQEELRALVPSLQSVVA
jgi:hypothetical protein